MAFASPGALVLGLLAAALVVALHYLARQRPPHAPFPTARFVPAGRARATAQARRPADLWLLLIRVSIVLLAAAAFAGPIPLATRRPLARVFLVDRSRAVSDSRAASRVLHDEWRPGDAVIVFDSAARALSSWPADSSMLAPGRSRGALSAALVAALRTTPRLRRAADSLELVVVSPVTDEEVDLAAPPLRALWPGSVRLVRTPATSRTDERAGGIDVRTTDDDPLAVAAALAGLRRGEAPTRLMRRPPTGPDLDWAHRDGHALVSWPGAEAPTHWLARATADTVGGVVAPGAVVIAPFVRRWVLPRARAVARWVDGEPAAIERATGQGCVREVAIELPTSGDLVLSPGFARLLRALGAPCAEHMVSPVLPDSMLRWLLAASAAAPSVAGAPGESSPLTPWLLAAALILALIEPLARHSARADAGGESASRAGIEEQPAPASGAGTLGVLSQRRTAS